VEDNVVQGGFGSAVLESLAGLGVGNVTVRLHGLPDEFVQQGSPAELYRMYKLDAVGIAEVVRDLLSTRRTNPTLELVPS
jgi:1-deoxy-D-xylulose-5-phosphate synthase